MAKWGVRRGSDEEVRSSSTLVPPAIQALHCTYNILKRRHNVAEEAKKTS